MEVASEAQPPTTGRMPTGVLTDLVCRRRRGDEEKRRAVRSRAPHSEITQPG